MSATPFRDEIRRRAPELFERFERAVERERRASADIPPLEVAELVMSTKGERINYDHIGKVLAEKLRRREGALMADKRRPKREVKPPDALTFLFCPVCGHDDMCRNFGAKHYARGRLCEGVPVTITYKLAKAGKSGR